jgi:hypothetical protein
MYIMNNPTMAPKGGGVGKNYRNKHNVGREKKIKKESERGNENPT